MLATLEELEQQHTRIGHKNHATAEMLISALQDYKQRARSELNRQILFKTSKPIVTCITLGDINFTLDQQTQKYRQTDPKTRALLDFYCGANHFDDLSADAQYTFLHYLRQHCQTCDDQFVITHVNKAHCYYFS